MTCAPETPAFLSRSCQQGGGWRRWKMRTPSWRSFLQKPCWTWRCCEMSHQKNGDAWRAARGRAHLREHNAGSERQACPWRDMHERYW